MKKILIGCGTLFILLAVVLVAGGAWLLKKARNFGAGIKAAQEQLDTLNREFPFTAPPDGALTEKQFAAWLGVREAILDLEDRRFAEIKKRGPLAVAEAIGAMPESVTACAEKLRREKMPPREYVWITDQVFGALKSRAAAKYPKLADLGAMLDKPVEAHPSARTRFRQENRLEIAPLGPEEAGPILELLQSQAERVRKVARIGFLDSFFQGGGPPHASPRVAADDARTTR